MYNNDLVGAMARSILLALQANKGSNQQAMSYDCYKHNKSFQYVCESCKMLLCTNCMRQGHAKHLFTEIDKFVRKGKNILQSLLESSRIGAQSFENSVNKELNYTRFIDENCNELTQNIRSSFRPLITALEDRERFLLEFVERLHNHRMNVLYEQMTALKGAYYGLVDTAEMLQSLGENAPRMENVAIAMRLVEAQNNLDKCSSVFKANQPQDEFYRFYSPQIPDNILQAIKQQGTVTLDTVRACKANENRSSTPLNDVSDILTTNSSNKGEEQHEPTLWKTHKRKSPEIDLDVTVAPRNLRKRSNEVCLADAEKIIASGIGQAVPGLMQKVKAFRCDVPTLAFATKGTNDGQVSRPWGVCVNKSGHIFVTDRRNHNIQAFGADGRFLYRFGSKGSANGEFDAPIGICADKSGRLIVADKNNHRVQVFSSTGKFLLTFGALGTKEGKLKFPFGVAVNTNLQIAVADSSNYRIQQFEHNGRFIREIQLGVCSATGLDIMPCGICYTPKGRIIVTDYANHCLHLVDAESKKIVSTKGSQGVGNLQFNCPSGICCDDEGTIIVADSHNQRIKVFNSKVECLWSFDVRPSVNCLNMSFFNETDRTCDVALTRDGRIVSVTEMLPAKEAVSTAKTFVHVY